MIPKWLEKRYEILFDTYQNNSFRFEEATEVLKKVFQDSENQINVFLSELRKRGWLTVSFDPKDARKRIYRLESKEKIISQTLSFDKTQLTRSDLEALLKAAADPIRTRVDYSFILVLLFYKRISDKWVKEFEDAYQEALEDGLNEEEANLEAKNSIYHDFDIPEGYHWEDLRKDPARLPENFSNAMKLLAEHNPELKDVFENYEWILRYFAPQKAKEGEVYTPREVIQLIVELLDPKPGESVYDPASGSGGMLITFYQHMEHHHGKEAADKLFLFDTRRTTEPWRWQK